MLVWGSVSSPVKGAPVGVWRGSRAGRTVGLVLQAGRPVQCELPCQPVPCSSRRAPPIPLGWGLTCLRRERPAPRAANGLHLQTEVKGERALG